MGMEGSGMRLSVLLLVAIVVSLLVAGFVVGLGAAGRRCSLLRERDSGSYVICTYDCPRGIAEITVRRRCPHWIEEPTQ